MKPLYYAFFKLPLSTFGWPISAAYILYTIKPPAITPQGKPELCVLSKYKHKSKGCCFTAGL